MSKILFTCALVVNLLIVSCTAGTAKTTKMPKLFNKIVDVAPLMDTIFGRIGELFSDSRSLNTAISNDNYGGNEQIANELFLDFLQQFLLTANKLENFSLSKRSKESIGQTISVPEEDLDDTVMWRQENIEHTNKRIV